MTGGRHEDIRRRLREIEDRKVEILLEIAHVDGDDMGRLSELNSEFTELDEEQYRLRMELIRKGRI
jgi:hypothetical protein